MRRSLEEVNIIQILLAVLSYLVLIGLVIWFFVIPTIKIYKMEYANYRENLRSYYDILNKHESLKSRLQNYRTSNEKILKAFQNPFKKEDFRKFAEKYLDNVQIEFKKSFVEDGFGVKLFEMRYLFKDIKSFYDFFDALNEYPSVIKLDFPIILESSHPPLVKGSWFFKVYESNSSI